VDTGAGAFGRSRSPPPIRYSPFRTKLVEIFGESPIAEPFNGCRYYLGTSSSVFLFPAMVKMYVFVDWACTFLKDEALIIYLL
jgi:hypothetical protein